VALGGDPKKRCTPFLFLKVAHILRRGCHLLGCVDPPSLSTLTCGSFEFVEWWQPFLTHLSHFLLQVVRPPSLGSSPICYISKLLSHCKLDWSLRKCLYSIVVIFDIGIKKDFGGHMVDGSFVWMLDVHGLIL
jgi:hypothetical protein